MKYYILKRKLVIIALILPNYLLTIILTNFFVYNILLYLYYLVGI